MDNRILELAEKIYAQRIGHEATSCSSITKIGIEDYHIKTAEASILAAQVFYKVKKVIGK